MENHIAIGREDITSEHADQADTESYGPEAEDEAMELPVIHVTVNAPMVHQGKLPPLYPNATPCTEYTDDNSPRSIDRAAVPEIRVTGTRGSIHPVDIDTSPCQSPRTRSPDSPFSDIVNFNYGQKYRKRLDLLSIAAGIIAALIMVIGAISFVFQPYVYNTAIGLWGGGLALCFGIYGGTTLVHCKFNCRFPVYHAYTGIVIAILFACSLVVAFSISLGFDRMYLFCTYKDGLGDCEAVDVVAWRVPPNYKFATARIWINVFGLFFSIVLIIIHGFEFVSVQKLSEIEEKDIVELDE